MTKYRPSKHFQIAMVCLCLPLFALIFGVLPELEAMKNPKIPGEIKFPAKRPEFKTKNAVSVQRDKSFGWSMDWLMESYEKLTTWDKNPWKMKFTGFGEHYFALRASKNPQDQARAKELRRLGDALYQQLLLRYPELAVPSKNVPPERNGFLKWLEFSERFPSDSSSKGLNFPEDLQKHLNRDGPWNAVSAKAWFTQEKLLMDEIRAIGLMPEQSSEGIDVDRYGFLPARLAKNCADALLMEARLAAEEGNTAAALESVQAANGLAAHFGNIETPSLLGITVQILVQMQSQKYSLTEIMPALPAGQLDPAAWENVLKPTVHSPDEYARIMKGEWSVSAREFLLPMLMDTEDPRCPSDPEALLDAHAGSFLNTVVNHEGRAITDWPNLPDQGVPDLSHLSRQSQGLISLIHVGQGAWRNGTERSVSAFAMMQAAFTILKGQPVPNDPIYGQPYVWDPATRKLSQPNNEVFKKLDLKPITLPKP